MDITGQLIKLRAFRVEDAPALTAMQADPAMSRYIGDWALGPYATEDAQHFIEQRTADKLGWAIECLADGACIVPPHFPLDNKYTLVLFCTKYYTQPKEVEACVSVNL